MQRWMRNNRTARWCLLLTAAALLEPARAGELLTSTSHPATQTAPAAVGEARALDFWPDLTWPTLCWFAAVVVLTLTIRLKLLALRTVDGLVLAAMCLMLALRGMTGPPLPGDHPWQWWGYVGLTIAVIYWLLRGVGLLVSSRPLPYPEAPPGGVVLVLVAVGLALGTHRIATAPVSAGSRDGLAGGLFTAASGKLPYGDGGEFGHRSPLLYLVHAAAIRAVESMVSTPDGDEAGLTMTWGNRDLSLAGPRLVDADLCPVALVNAVLFVLTLAGLYLTGSRLLGEGVGWTLVALFCVLPGTLECLPRPEIMIPALLLTWTFALALLPGVGGVLATACLVLCGLAWPWAWLGMPVLLAYCWRRPWQGLGSTLGLLGGLALCAFGLLTLVQPALPQAQGALVMAGRRPAYSARLAEKDTVVIDRREQPGEPIGPRAASGYLWQLLLDSEALTLKQAVAGNPALRIDWPNGVNSDAVLFQEVEAGSDALPVLQQVYRDALRPATPWTRLLVSARTVLEHTWPLAGGLEQPVTGAWALWSGAPTLEGRWLLARRVTKLVVGLLVVWAALVVFFGRRFQPRHLLGGFLITASGTLLASECGAVADLVWLTPPVLALWAMYEPAPPRISVESGAARPP